MEIPPQSVAEKDFLRAQKEFDEGNVLAALACLEHGLNIHDDPLYYSFLGFCMAKERGHVTKGLELCNRAIEHDPENPLHYLYLGKVHLIAGKKMEALNAWRQGMRIQATPEIERLLATIGNRKPPIIPFLSRDNFLNKYLGMALHRLGLR